VGPVVVVVAVWLVVVGWEYLSLTLQQARFLVEFLDRK